MNDATSSQNLKKPDSAPQRRQRRTAQSRRAVKTTNKASKTLARNANRPTVSDGSFDDGLRYHLDLWQRSILFWDVLRQRANNMLEQD